ncbi:hypothetical protein [Niabella beijingensis]|uniref:hypothetical protein n=1 Tax=Niabella beijingensis TaxID=2872700 RepID=UPI001CBE3E18|nr:hypothetical protein [Niabella beijingensis]MBZ4191902.1 hypothetical protein [Niabella beijingensis]
MSWYNQQTVVRLGERGWIVKHPGMVIGSNDHLFLLMARALSGELTAADSQAFDACLRSEEWRDLYQQLKRLWTTEINAPSGEAAEAQLKRIFKKNAI